MNLRNYLLLLMLIIPVHFLTAQTDPFAGSPVILSQKTDECLGVAFGDYDNDGWVDLIITRGNSSSGTSYSNLWFHNNGGTLEKISVSGYSDTVKTSVGASWGDYDNDGFLDLYYANAKPGSFPSTPIPENHLLKGDGTGNFSLITSAGPIVSDKEDSRIVGWGDYNNDGLLDMFVDNNQTNFGNQPAQNTFYTNIDGTSFQKETTSSIGNLVSDGSDFKTFGSGFGWCDYNNDGYVDLFNCSGFGYKNRMWKNNNGTGFVEVLNPFFQDTTGGERMASAGASWGDYNNDGKMDLFLGNQINDDSGNGVTNPDDPDAGRNYLYKNRSTATTDDFVFLGAGAGAVYSDYYYTQGSIWGDFDNDGDLDLFTANRGSDPEDISRLYMNSGSPSYNLVPITSDIEQLDPGDGSTRGEGRGAAAADIDKDGDLDIVVARIGKPLLYMNNGNSNNYIRIKLEGNGQTNTTAIGAKAKILATIPEQEGPTWQMRQVAGITGGLGQDEQIMHFGLGSASIVDSLVIEWPASGLVEIYTDLAPNNLYSFIEGSASQIHDDPELLSGDYYLAQNYPNPFNPETYIRYKLATAGNVRLELHNSLGQKISTIYNGFQSAGTHQIRFNARGLASGVYYYSIMSRHFKSIKKMIVLQ